VNQYRNEWRVFNPIKKFPEGKRPLDRPRRRWEDNSNVAVQEMKWVGVDRIDPAYDRNKWLAVVNAATNLVVP
jgi:hypothetical protein